MFVKLGDSFIMSLIVEDSSGNRITDDSPVVTFYDTKAKQYWNGIAWQANKFIVYMQYQDNGVYIVNFTPDHVGSFIAAAKSNTYDSAQTINVDVYDESIAKYGWQTNVPFIASHTRTNDLPTTTPPTIVVNRIFDNTFLDVASSWSNAPVSLNMTHIGSNVFTFTFAPDISSEYILTVVDDDYEAMFAITVSEAGSDVAPVMVGSSTLLAMDNTDTTVLSNTLVPLQGATIKAYNAVSKEIVSTATTNNLGQWSMLLKPGRYFFMFEKDSYQPSGFERTVS